MPDQYNFTECPLCHNKGTVCQEICAEDENLPADQFYSLEKVFTPLQDPTRMIGPYVKGIMVHYDICSNPKCGFKRCTRAEVTKVPMQMTVKGPPSPPLRGN